MKLFKPVAVTFGFFVLVALITGVLFYVVKLPAVGVTMRFLLLGILSINILALLTLVFFVGKNLFRLYAERRYKVLGYKFKTKLMMIFGVLTLIPSALLFVASSGLVTNYINYLFSPRMKEPISQSIEVVKRFYDFEREQVLVVAQGAAKKRGAVPPGMYVRRYASLPENASDIMKDAFEGREGTEVISRDEGDAIRAAVPDMTSERQGIVVAELVLPKDISSRSGKLSELYEDYLKQISFKAPLRLNFIFILGFLTLLIVFAALWVSIKISRSITVPIQNLALATERIAAGDLEVKVDLTSEDEIGLLTSSFNDMVSQLREHKVSLESAYTEIDRRRVYLETILENINSGVIFFDPQGSIVTMNRIACSMLNIGEKDAAKGKSYQEFIKSLNSEELEAMVKDLEGKSITEFKRIVKVTVDGRNALFRIYVAGLRDSTTAKSLGMLVVFDDLTDVIEAQKAIAWREVAQRLAHEIKNPLTPIRLSTERLLKKWHHHDEDFGKVLEKSAKTIIAEVESLKKLVDVFSRYGRMPELHKTDMEVAELVDAATSLYKGFKDVVIEVTIQEDLPLVSVDAEQFKRVLINVIDNAIKAMEGKGEIAISVKAHENTILFDIADTGPGIKDDVKEKLFTPYFSKTKGGTGLGLAIANKIVIDHHGRIMVKDNTPHGTVFTIEMPMG